MSSQFVPKNFEEKWRKQWEEKGIYKMPEANPNDETFYSLYSFPYPSGAGLHVGHVEGMVANDVPARFARMNGKKVVLPMGWDSFGLPAENYAIKTGIHPEDNTNSVIETFKEQINKIGISVAWETEVGAHRDDYYKWTQWIFLQLYKHGLAYKKKAPVNWCPQDQTVLANEQVLSDGTCERCGSQVEQKDLEQWFFKITDYADALVDDLNKVDWPESTKIQQREWIGRSEGAEVEFRVKPHPKPLSIKHGEGQTDKDEESSSRKKRITKAIEFARENRQHSTETEQLLWEELRNRKLGEKFRRQHPIEDFIADFACPSKNIIIEVDGGIHNYTKQEDRIRSERLSELGYKVIRFTNDQVLHDLAGTVETIKAALLDSPLTSSVNIDTPLHETWRGDGGEVLKIFTTRPDTIFGATFLVIAPENKLIQKLKNSIANYSEIEAYVEQAKNKTDLERQQNKDKSGIKIEGITAINPATGEEIPVYVADYVLGSYGTAAIMAVPAHDERDFEFANKYNIEITQVIDSKGEEMPFTKDGALINSDNFNGTGSSEAKDKIVSWLAEKGEAKKVTNYRLRDWLVSRQRYWGCPIPVIYKELDEEEKARQERYNASPQLVFNFHAFGSDANSKYHPWIQNKLVDLGIKSLTPTLPTPAMPKLDEWVASAKQGIEAESSDNIVITGRSLGCWSALKLAESKKLRKLVLVAPSTPVELETQGAIDAFSKESGVWENLKEFIIGDSADINFDLVEQNVGEIVVYLSTDDPYIDLSKTQKYFEEHLQKTKFKYFNNVSHFSYLTEFPELLNEIIAPVDITISAVPEEDLPVKLPYNVEFAPTGESPLAKSEEFQKSAEEKYGKGWRREVDTMDTFIDSSWYFFRHLDASNSNEIFNTDKVNKWLPTDLYMIGAEHIVLHLLYARFFTKFFKDIGLINFDEPFQKMRHMGLILGPDGRKMSKRWGNIINPTDEIEKYGADALRMYEMFMGPLEDAKPWNDRAENGVFRFLMKVWNNKDKVEDEMKSDEQEKEINKLIKKVTEDIENMSFNTAIAKMMEFVNFIHKEKSIAKNIWERFLLVMAPFAPYITEELWSEIGNEFSIHQQAWPTYSDEFLKESIVTLGVQINGKLRGTIEISANATQEEAMQAARSVDNINKYIGEGEPKKVIFISGRVLNIVV